MSSPWHPGLAWRWMRRADGAPEHGQGQFAEAYEEAGDERSGSGSIG